MTTTALTATDLDDADTYQAVCDEALDDADAVKTIPLPALVRLVRIAADNDDGETASAFGREVVRRIFAEEVDHHEVDDFTLDWGGWYYDLLSMDDNETVAVGAKPWHIRASADNLPGGAFDVDIDEAERAGCAMYIADDLAEPTDATERRLTVFVQ